MARHVAVIGAGIVGAYCAGMLAQIPGWLLDPLGSLIVRWRYVPRRSLLLEETCAAF